MKIDPNEIKLPFKKTVQTFNGETEVSLSAMDSKESAIYKSYMSSCAMDDKMFVNTAGMDKTQTMSTCAGYYGEVEDMLNEEAVGGGLTPGQKKLPPALQQAILKKMGEKSPEKTEDAKASGQKTKTLSKDDKVETKPSAESLDVVKAAEIEKEVCDTCKK
jgi:hypothetical protein